MQEKQPRGRVRMFFVSDSPPTLSAVAKYPFPEVPGRQPAYLVEDVDQDVRSVGLEPAAADGVVFDHVVRLDHRLPEAFHIGDADRPRPPDGDRLEVLRTHHGADAGPARRPAAFVHDVGEEDLPLTRGADQGHRRLFVRRGPDGLGRLGHYLAPEGRRIAELHLVVVDPEVDRFFRLPLEDDQVIARILEHRAEDPAGAGGGDRPGQGAFRHHVEMARRRGVRSGEGAGGEDEFVVRAQGIDLRIDLVGEDTASQTAGADVLSGQLGIQRFLGDGPGGQIDA